MLDFKTVYDSASKREKDVLDKINGNTLDSMNMVYELRKLSKPDLEILLNISELYKSLDQNQGFIKVLDKALEKVKTVEKIITQTMKSYEHN